MQKSKDWIGDRRHTAQTTHRPPRQNQSPSNRGAVRRRTVAPQFDPVPASTEFRHRRMRATRDPDRHVGGEKEKEEEEEKEEEGKVKVKKDKGA